MSFLSDIFNPIGHAFEDAGNAVYGGLKTVGQGIYDAGDWAYHQARPIVAGLAPAAGTALGGFVGGPMGAMAGNALGSMAGNYLSGGEEPTGLQRAVSTAGSAYLGNRFGANNNYGRGQSAPRGQVAARPGMRTQPVQDNRMRAQPVRRQPQRGFSHGGLAYAQGGHNFGRSVGNFLSGYIPESWRNASIGSLGPRMGAMAGRRLGTELERRLPADSLSALAGKLGHDFGGALSRRLPEHYAHYGHNIGEGIGSFGQHLLKGFGIGDRNLSQLLSLPERGESYGRHAGGMFSNMLRPHLSRDMRRTTFGEMPGHFGGKIGSAIEDRFFPSHHGRHGHHNGYNEEEALSQLLPMAHGGHVEHDEHDEHMHHGMNDYENMIHAANMLEHRGVH